MAWPTRRRLPAPLQIAVERGDLDIVKCLKGAGANAELARLTVATKLHKLKAGRHSRSASALQLGHLAGSRPSPQDKGKRPVQNGYRHEDMKGKRSMSLGEPLNLMHHVASSSSMASGADGGPGSTRSSSFTSTGSGAHARPPPVPRVASASAGHARSHPLEERRS